MKIKFPVGSTEENNQLLLEPGFVTFDRDRKALRLHDGVTPGGFEVVGEQAVLPINNWTSRDLVDILGGGKIIYRILPTGITSTPIALAAAGGAVVAFTGSDLLTAGITSVSTDDANAIMTRVSSNGVNTIFHTGSRLSQPGAFIRRQFPGSTALGVLNITGLSSINASAYGNGLWVVAGANGRIATTSDTQPSHTSNWIQRDSGTTSTIIDLIFSSNWFLAITSNGQLIVSNDGITWSVYATYSGYLFTRVLRLNNKWCVIGSEGTNGRLLINPTGNPNTPNWSIITIPPNNVTYQLKGFGYGGGYWFASYPSGNIQYTQELVSPTNGSHWEQIPSVSGNVWDFHFSHNRMVAAVGTQLRFSGLLS